MRRFRFPSLSHFAACVLVLMGLTLDTPSAQVAGRNVNMVTGGTFPGGDPFLQKQNEPSIAISTRNPCHLLAGANDYRAVNLAGLPADKEIGDAWLGWYESTDCGSTWYSTLVPGYPQDKSPEGLASPVKGLSTGADPGLRAGAAGTFYYLFIAFNRGTNVGKLALARGIDHNDRDAFVDPDLLTISVDGITNARKKRSPIQYVGTTEMARGSSGQFIDKPSLAVFPATSGTCTMDGETVPATNVYVAWTEFVGNSPENLRSKVYFARSLDCGRTVASFTKLSEGFPLGQGTQIGVNPKNPNDIYVVWRQIRSARNGDAMLFARSTDGGRSFTHAQPVPGLAEGQFIPFDQNTTSTLLNNPTTTFRTVGYPTLAFSDEGTNGQLYLAYATPLVPNTTGGLGGVNSRIMIMRTDGTTWTNPVQAVPTSDNGSQIMPALAYAAGKLQLIWYDFRFDETGLTASPLIDEAQALQQPRFTPRRHTVDLLGAQAILPQAAWPPAANFFKSYGVSQPDLNDFPTTRGPRISQYTIGDPDPTLVEGGPRQLQYNFSGLLLYGGGTIPFMGDYNDVNGTSFVTDATGKWIHNGLAGAANSALGTFHAAWTDNRDARLGPGAGIDAVLGYTPPGLPSCNSDNTRTRDANVYTSRITQDFSLTAPGNAKSSGGFVRAFAVQLANGTNTQATFQLTLTDTNASFSRATFGRGICPVPVVNALVQNITVLVGPNSSAARTVYVNCGANPLQRIIVTATRTNPAGGVASVVINADPSNPGPKDANGNPIGPETHTPDPENPDPENPGGQTPDPENPDPENKDAPNPDPENPDPENLNAQTPDPENPDPENPDPENVDPHTPDPENPDPENATFQDVSIDLTNDGNTTSGFQVQVQSSAATAGYEFVLMGRRVYGTPTAVNCDLKRYLRNQFLFSMPYDAADLTRTEFLDETDGSLKNATVIVRPDEAIRITLRIVWNGLLPDGTARPAFCSPDPNDPNACFKKLLFRTKAQAANTGFLDPDEASVGSGPDLTLTGTVTPSPMLAGFGGFVDSSQLTIVNNGDQDTGGSFSWVSYIRSDTTGQLAAGFFDETGGLAAGQSILTGPFRATIPFGYGDIDIPTPLPAGPYFMGMAVDSGLDIAETNESNNRAESASPITVVPYSVAFNLPTFNTPGPLPVSVTVTGPGGALIAGATVTLSLEGPDTVDGVPGPPAAPGNLVPTAPQTMTTGTGVANFSVTINSLGNFYRFVATVNIPGVGTLKFQSGLFDVFSS